MLGLLLVGPAVLYVLLVLPVGSLLAVSVLLAWGLVVDLCADR